jgi:hypothetical protein
MFHYRQKDIAQYFASAGDVVYCTDVEKVMAALGQDHKTDEWQLFVDSSKHSPKQFFTMETSIPPYQLLTQCTRRKLTKT